MAERKRLGGAPPQYLNIGRNMLIELRQRMRLTNLMVGRNVLTLPDGVTILVSSVFGQDTVDIDASSASQEVQDDMARIEEDVPHYFGHVGLVDKVQITSMIKLTMHSRISTGPISATPGSGTNDVAPVWGEVKVVMRTRTRPPVGQYPVGPSVIIGGGTSGGDGFVWDDYNGYTQLDNGGNWALQRRNAAVYAISPDGTKLAGNVEAYDPAPNKAITNPYTGQAPAIGWILHACKWQSRTDKPQLPAYNHDSGSWPDTALSVSNDGNTVQGVLSTGDAFTWDGKENASWSKISKAPAQSGLTSPDKRVTVSRNGYYTLDGVTKYWRGSLGLARDAPSDAVAYCVVHVNPPTATTQPPDVITEAVFVFSG